MALFDERRYHTRTAGVVPDTSSCWVSRKTFIESGGRTAVGDASAEVLFVEKV